MKGFYGKMQHYIKKHRLIVRGDHVLVGCSGGIDSVVLLHFLATHQADLGINVSAVHVNHMLRGEESLQDRFFTEQLCAEWKVPCYSRDIPIPELLKAEGGNKQQLCRTERYAYFAEVMELTKASKLATAHHADDQLETILMGGMKGALHSSFGMPANRPFETGYLVRPMLSVTKEDIAQYARFFALAHREDPSNQEPVYTRNRIRHSIVPLLKEENVHVSEQFAELAEQLQEDQRFLLELAETRLQALLSKEEKGFALSAKKFNQEPLALQKRMVLLLLNYLYNEKHVAIAKQLAEQVRELMCSSAGTVFLHLPQNYMMVRQYDRVYFSRQPFGENALTRSMAITHNWSSEVNGFRYKAVPLNQVNTQDNASFWYFSASGTFPLMVRSRKPGDRIHLKGMEEPKKVARLMIDEKVPASARESWPVIVSASDEILLVPGLRPSKFVSRFKRAEDNWVLIEQQI